MIFVIDQIKFITGLNPHFKLDGFFVVKNVGILFLNRMVMSMVAQESQNNKFAEN